MSMASSNIYLPKKSLSLLDVSFFLLMITIPIEVIATKYWLLPFSLSLPFGLLFVFLFVLSPVSKVSFRVPWQLILPVSYLLICLVHYAFSDDFEYINVLTGIFNNLLLSIVIYNYLLRRDHISQGLMIMSLTTLVCGILMLITEGANLQQTARYTVIEFDPNNLANILAFGIMIALTTYRKPSIPRVYYYILFGMGLLTLIILISTGSRGAMAALLLGFIWYLMVNWSKRAYKPRNILFVLIIVGSAVYLYMNSEIASTRWQYTLEGKGDVAYGERDVIYSTALEMILDRPIVGWGLRDGFWEIGERMGQNAFKGSHNTYLQILVSSGVLGGLPFFVFLYYPFSQYKKFKGDDHFKQLIVLYGFILFVFLSLDWLNRKQLWIIYPMILAIISNSSSAAKSQILQNRKT